MQIQKGLVKYKDRTDIVCTYGLTDDGKQYYFLDENSIPNGNIIASTVLVEAIDPVVVASSVGVIDRAGKIIIPFENKAVKPVGEGLLLVEKATATTPSVVDAIKLRSEPLAATKLVTTPATIKDKMNAKMGSNGRFIFNDQFSEATIYDIDGNNLISNEYYSFIGLKNNEALYFSKNTVDSPVTEFVLPNVSGIEVPLPSETTEKLDVENTDVTQETIDGAMVGDITASSFEEMANSQKEQGKLDNNSLDGVAEVPVSPDETTKEEEINAIAPPVNEEKTEKVVLDTSLTTDTDEKEFDSYALKEEAIELPIAASAVEKEEQSETNVKLNLDLDDSEEDETEKLEEVKTVDNNIKPDDKLMAFDFKDNINYDEEVEHKVSEHEVEEVVEDPFESVTDFKQDLIDMDLETDIFADSTFKADKIINDSYDDSSFRGASKDTLIEDVSVTLSNMIKLNKSQREKIAAYEEKIAQVVETHKSFVEKARSQVREMDTLKSKIKSYEAIVNKLENKIQNLEDKVHDQDRLIVSQSNELEALRPQAEGKRELARILADAQDLLEHAE